MSHYTVAVFTDRDSDVDELLAPYDENIRVAPYIGRTRQQMIEDGRVARRRAKENPDASWLDRYRTANTDEELYALERNEEHDYDTDGNELTTYNPDSKWDWYVEGGRWDGAFDTYGIDPRGTRVGDIKTLFDPGAYQEASRFWELYVENDIPKNEEEREIVQRVFYKKEYYAERYGDKETFAKESAGFSTYAVVTPDGVWHEPGQMGWFGCSAASDDESRDWYRNYIDRFLKTADPDWTLTIVDCHI